VLQYLDCDWRFCECCSHTLWYRAAKVDRREAEFYLGQSAFVANLSILTAIFPGGPALAGTRMSLFWILLELWMM